MKFIVILFLLMNITVSCYCDGIRIAVVSFEDKTGKAGNILVRSLIDSTTDELYKTGKFTLLERDRIGHVLKEQKLALTGLIDTETASVIGKLLGASYVLIGTVVNYGESVQENTIGGANTTSEKFGIGGLSISKLNLFIDLNIRIIEVDTGKIVFSSSGNESFRKTSYGLTVVQDGELVLVGRKLSDSTLGQKIARKALSKAVEKLLFFPFKLKEMQTRIVKLDGDNIIIGRGHGHGLKRGDQFKVYGKPERLMDPVTGEDLGSRRKILINKSFRLIQVERNFSVCQINDKYYLEKIRRDFDSLDISKGEFLQVRMALKTDEKHYNKIIDYYERGFLKKTVHM
ncbi:hypothetical protein KAJ27_10660, partial [bacterium]|nr:hypothetical protein [bacterium]